MDALAEWEITKIGIYDSRYAYAQEAGSMTPDRAVNQYEIELFMEDGGAAYINGRGYDVHRGCVLVSKPGQRRHSRLHIRTYYIHLEVYSKDLRRQMDGISDFFEVTQEQRYISIFQALMDASGNAFEGSGLYMRSKVYELFYMLYTDSLRACRRAALSLKCDRQVLLRAKRFIETHYRQPVHLPEVAAAVNLSPIYFHKLFKAFNGKTPHRYLLDVRLAAAKKLLLSAEYSVEEIALSCGFSSPSYFNACFKRETGVTPLQFRKNELLKYGL